jgi:Carboxypeptidase regulatory-like domain
MRKNVKAHSCAKFTIVSRACAFFVLLFAALYPALGQSTYGSFVGTITDASGAVVANATVTVTSTSTGESRKAATDARGNFSVVNLDAGDYSATVTAPGFNPKEFKTLHLQARETVPLDTTLQVGGGNEAVVVNATSADIDADLTKGDTKTGQQINQLALNFRASNATSPIVAATLAPEVQVDQSGNYSIAGGLPTETSFSLDGISTQNVRHSPRLRQRELYPAESLCEHLQLSTSGGTRTDVHG